MMDCKKCPTCNSRLFKLREPEKSIYTKNAKYPDEDVYWCSTCKTHLFEEDLLFNTEE
jgi:DNA-directed RNA polymerase subunit RPC12/RpoP